jgi:hypothetical protein
MAIAIIPTYAGFDNSVVAMSLRAFFPPSLRAKRSNPVIDSNSKNLLIIQSGRPLASLLRIYGYPPQQQQFSLVERSELLLSLDLISIFLPQY